MKLKINLLGLNPLSRVNCILINFSNNNSNTGKSLNPLSRVNCILIWWYWKKSGWAVGLSLNPLSGVNCILMEKGVPPYYYWQVVSQSPKSGQLHSNNTMTILLLKSKKSQSPKSGQLHSNL